MKIGYQVGQLVKSKLPQHNELTTWRIIEFVETISGKKKVLCEAAHDIESRGFDKIFHEFKINEIEEK